MMAEVPYWGYLNYLFTGLSDGGKVEMDLQDMFWGDYYGSCSDKYGVRWMFNCAEKKS